MDDNINPVGLYDQDFVAWGIAQAEALRALRGAVQHSEVRNPKLRHALLALDLENLAEEIEGLARRDRRELTSRVMTIIEHLAKLQYSAVSGPRAGWAETVGRARGEIDDILRDSPSLRRELAEVVARKTGPAVGVAAKSLALHGEITEAVASRLAATYSVDQVIGDWWPEQPAQAARKRPRKPA